jgi:hypothetical protein
MVAIVRQLDLKGQRGEAERLRDALTRIAREAERREPERAAGLLGERWMRERSNGPSAAR